MTRLQIQIFLAVAVIYFPQEAIYNVCRLGLLWISGQPSPRSGMQ